MRRAGYLTFPIALILFAAPAAAKTFVVPRDYETIQAAVDAAGDGDKVVVKAGTYRENVVVRDKEEFKLRAKGKVYLDPDGGGTALRVEGVTTMRIRGFRIRNAGENGIEIVDCERIELRKNRIRNCGRTGLAVLGGNHFNLERLEIEDCGEDGIFIGQGEGTSFARRVNVQKCRIERAFRFGVYVEGELYHQVRKNRIYGCGWGVFFGPDAESSRADKNRIEDSVQGAVGVAGFNCLARRNRIKRSDGVGIDVSGTECSVRKNRLKKVGGTFLRVAGELNTVVGNRGQDVEGHGIEVGGRAHFVKGNKAKDVAGAGVLVTATEAEFRKNRIRRAGSDGFFVASGAVDNLFRRNATEKSGGAGLVDENPPGANTYEKNSFK